MEEIIGLLVLIAVGIFKVVVERKLKDAGKQPQKPSQPFGTRDPFGEDEEVFTPEPDPLVPKPDPFAPKVEPMAPQPVAPKPVAPKPQPTTMALEDVKRQIKARKPMLIEEEEKSPKEPIDPKKLVLYSEIMNPKFNE